jgi:hypothetical protein
MSEENKKRELPPPHTGRGSLPSARESGIPTERQNASSQTYSGQAPGLVTGHDHFHVNSPVRTIFVERRRHPRIPCRDVRANVRTKEAASVIVDVPNISRNGACIRSFEQFCPETAVSIATHYIEGGQNIFQNGRIVWAQSRASDLPAEYGVEFLLKR